MSTQRKPSPVDMRAAQLREQAAAREALVRRSPPPPPQFSAVELRTYFLARLRPEAEAERKP